MLKQEHPRLYVKPIGKWLRQLKAGLERYKNLQHSKNKLILRKEANCNFTSHLSVLSMKNVSIKNIGEGRDTLFLLSMKTAMK